MSIKNIFIFILVWVYNFPKQNVDHRSFFAFSFLPPKAFHKMRKGKIKRKNNIKNSRAIKHLIQIHTHAQRRCLFLVCMLAKRAPLFCRCSFATYSFMVARNHLCCSETWFFWGWDTHTHRERKSGQNAANKKCLVKIKPNFLVNVKCIASVCYRFEWSLLWVCVCFRIPSQARSFFALFL